MFTQWNTFDLLFILSAVAFNLLIAALFIAQKYGKEKLVKTFGLTWLGLLIPFTVIFVQYVHEGRSTKILISLCMVFLYMLIELLLDYVLKVDFRSKTITHVPYIILEYVALFSLIAIAFDIDQAAGILVSICFWILMGCLVFLYWNKITKRDKKT